jgi:hypothetical protein
MSDTSVIYIPSWIFLLEIFWRATLSVVPFINGIYRRKKHHKCRYYQSRMSWACKVVVRSTPLVLSAMTVGPPRDQIIEFIRAQLTTMYEMMDVKIF